MSSIVDGIVSDISTGFEDFEAITEDSLHNESNTVRFDLDIPVAYMATLSNGSKIEARTTLRNAHLTRLVKAENPYRNTDRPGTYTQVSGDFRNVHMQTEVMLNDEWISLTEFLRIIYSAVVKNSTSNNEADFAARIRNLGYRFEGDATLLWQHFGASNAAWADLDQKMRDNGAYDDTKGRSLNRITDITRFPSQSTGFNVISVDVSSADRTQSVTQQGFTNFVDAGVESVMRTLRYRALAKAEKAKAVGENAAMHNQRAAHLTSQATSWSSNLAGIQERMTLDPTGQIIRLGAEGAATDHQVDPGKAQIGRMVLDINGDYTEIDLWTRPDALPEPAIANIAVPDDISSINSDNDSTAEESEF